MVAAALPSTNALPLATDRQLQDPTIQQQQPVTVVPEAEVTVRPGATDTVDRDAIQALAIEDKGSAVADSMKGHTLENAPPLGSTTAIAAGPAADAGKPARTTGISSLPSFRSAAAEGASFDPKATGLPSAAVSVATTSTTPTLAIGASSGGRTA